MSTLGRIPTSVSSRRRISPSFRTLKWLSFAHSAIYIGLITLWISDTAPGVKTILGWGHGWGWILMCVLCVLALRARVIPLWLAVCVAVIGAVGPFVGSIGFLVEERRHPARLSR
ncbi:MAG: hypothetical protein WC558_09910 [Patulibacter sp.]